MRRGRRALPARSLSRADCTRSPRHTVHIAGRGPPSGVEVGEAVRSCPREIEAHAGNAHGQDAALKHGGEYRRALGQTACHTGCRPGVDPGMEQSTAKAPTRARRPIEAGTSPSSVSPGIAIVAILSTHQRESIHITTMAIQPAAPGVRRDSRGDRTRQTPNKMR